MKKKNYLFHASKSDSNNNSSCATKMNDSGHVTKQIAYSSIPGLYSSILPRNRSYLASVSSSFPSWISCTENDLCKRLKKKHIFYNKKNDLLHSFHVTTNNDLYCVSNNNNYSLPLFCILKKNSIKFLPSTLLLIFILYIQGVHCIWWNYWRKVICLLCSFHTKFCALKMNMTNNNNLFCVTKKWIMQV